MARYIDANKLIQRLEREVESCKDPNRGSALGFKMAISIVQTFRWQEDVVPRAEYDELNAKYITLETQEEKENLYCKNVCEPRYKAEIDRLKQNNADRAEFFSALIEAEKRKAKRLKTIAEAEAIKEFARRVKATFPSREDPRCTDDDIFTLDSIDTIMNNMLSVLEGETK
jgi:hypothetical protein